MKLLKVLFLTACLFCSMKAFAQAPDLTINSTSGFPGQGVNGSVTADLTTAINSAQFTLKYDPALLTLSSVSVGTANSTWTIVDNASTPGTVIVGMFNAKGTSATSVNGTAQQIAAINFTVNATPGTPTLTTPNFLLSNVVVDQTNVTSIINGNFVLGMFGDIDGDGKVTIADAALVASEVVGLTTFTPGQTTAAEVDGTSVVDIYDAYLIAECVAGLTTLK